MKGKFQQTSCKWSFGRNVLASGKTRDNCLSLSEANQKDGKQKCSYGTSSKQQAEGLWPRSQCAPPDSSCGPNSSWASRRVCSDKSLLRRVTVYSLQFKDKSQLRQVTVAAAIPFSPVTVLDRGAGPVLCSRRRLSALPAPSPHPEGQCRIEPLSSFYNPPIHALRWCHHVCNWRERDWATIVTLW